MLDSLNALIELLSNTPENPKILLDSKNKVITILLFPTPYVLPFTQEGISEAIEEIENDLKTILK